MVGDGSIDTRHAWTVISDSPEGTHLDRHAASSRPYHQQTLYANGSGNQFAQADSPVMLHVPYIERPRPLTEAGPSNAQHVTASRRGSPPSDGGSGGVVRYSPYPASPLHGRLPARESAHSRSITLPSVQPRGDDDGESTTLPPISAMTRPTGVHDDPMAILRRLQSDDDASSRTSSSERSSHGRRPSATERPHRL